MFLIQPFKILRESKDCNGRFHLVPVFVIYKNFHHTISKVREIKGRLLSNLNYNYRFYIFFNSLDNDSVSNEDTSHSIILKTHMVEDFCYFVRKDVSVGNMYIVKIFKLT